MLGRSWSGLIGMAPFGEVQEQEQKYAEILGVQELGWNCCFPTRLLHSCMA